MANGILNNTPTTTRSDRLSNLARNIDIFDQQASNRAAAAQAIQLQAGLAQAPVTNITRQAQTIAPTVATAAGEAGLQQQAATQQLFKQAAGQELEQQQQQTQQQLATAQRVQQEATTTQQAQQAVSKAMADINARKQVTQAEIDKQNRLANAGIDYDNTLNTLTLKQREQLNSLGNDLKGKLFDSTLAFERDETGRKFSNDRQLMDYTVASAKSSDEVNARLQQWAQANNKSIMLQQAAIKRLEQALEQGRLSKQQKLNQLSRQEIGQMIAASKKALVDKQEAAANRANVIKNIFTIVGGVVGAVYGGPAGAAGGAAVGSAVGGGISGAAG